MIVLPAIALVLFFMGMSGGIGSMISYCWEQQCYEAIGVYIAGAGTMIVCASEFVGNAMLVVLHSGASTMLT